MPVFRDQRILRRNLLLKDPWNMIPMQSATTMVIITEKVTNAVITMAMKAAAIITVKTMSADIITEKDSTAAMKRVTRAAAVIMASKML